MLDNHRLDFVWSGIVAAARTKAGIAVEMTAIRHPIVLHDETYQRLKKFGRFGETYTDVINRLLDTVDKRK